MLQTSETQRSKLHFGVLHEIFEVQANARPDAVAVLFDGKKITYAELEKKANRLARHLQKRGVQTGSLVAILLPRSVDAYASILAVLKAGAAYVPVDPEYPTERVDYILKDAGVTALLTTDELAKRHQFFCDVVIKVDVDSQAIDAENAERLPAEAVQVGPEDLCYVIYTSGSTGHPKGVQIEHRSACNLVMAEEEIFQVRPGDRVCQAASLSFDLSVEEIWLAFNGGATLVVSTQGISQSGPDFSRFLAENNVTILSCVPTLLSMLQDELPTLRLIILGGEKCPEWLVIRWARSGRRIVNTYGPTETTVIATYSDLIPGKPVTIGRAASGYRVYILDDSLQPVPRGTVGEICICGIGVARGYVGLEKETHERFVNDPFAPTDELNARMYLTGDLGRFDDDGNVEFVGRRDAQVKMRGFRIELSEIESVLMQHSSVLTAACTVREDMPGIQQLVGYVIPSNGKVDEKILRSHLRERLPGFMMPSLIETVSELPLFPSGKLDRASLPAPKTRQTISQSTKNPRTDTEHRIFRVWQDLFQPQPVSIDDNFFLDLGGHSLLAARMVSELRKDPRFANISVADAYEYPTIESLSLARDNLAQILRSPQKTLTPNPISQVTSTSKRRGHLIATIIQLLGLYPIFAIRAFQWITPYLVFFFILESGHSMWTALGWAAASIIAVFPLLFFVTVVAKWIILGRVTPGRYPLWGAYHLRWWFVQALVSSLPLDYLAGTPLITYAYRLFGVRIGRDVHIATDHIAAFDLISIGDGSSIDDDASLLGYTIEGGELVIAQIQVGRGCFVGTRSVLREDTVMEDGARLEDLSLLPRGMRIPRGQTWAGSPAQLISNSESVPARPPARGSFHHVTITTLYGALVLLLPLVLFLSVLPGLDLLASINPVTNPFLYLPVVPLVGASFVFLLAIEVALLKWLIVGRARSGTYPVHGSYYIRNWIVDQLLALSLDLIGPLHATLYVVPWYRMLGAKIGRFVEFSTASSNTPDLLDIGDESTIADEASVGASRIERGWMTLAPTYLGRRTFVGNSAVIPANSVMGEHSLLGVLSISPPKPDDASKRGASWLGSPPVLLPHRQPSCAFSDGKTFCPPRKLRLIRGSIEVFRITLPPAGFILVAAAVIGSIIDLSRYIGFDSALFVLPIVYGACCAAVAFAVVLAKRIIIGRFQPFTRPLWSTFIWRLEFVNALYEFLATPLALEPLRGTPLLPAFSRLLGAKMGRDVYMHTTGLLEFDLIEVGDRVALNEDCVLQTHLFEDRVLKASNVSIGNDCDVGATSVVLYDSKMEDGSRLDAVSLLMKGETLPAKTAWAGIPARRSND